MSLCRTFSNPPVACLVRDKCRCRFFAIIGHNTNVAVVRNLCDAVSSFYNLLLSAIVSAVLKRRSTTHKSTSYNFTYNFVIDSLEICHKDRSV